MKRKEEIKSKTGAVEFHHFYPTGAELPILPPDLAEREPYVRELLLEGFVHVLFEVRGFDIFDDRGLKRKTRGGGRMNTLSAPYPRTPVLDSSLAFRSHTSLTEGVQTCL